MRRELGETVAELADVFVPGQDVLRVTGMLLDLPMEVQLRQTPEGPRFLADVPRWRWRTVFDQHPGRMRVGIETMPEETAKLLCSHIAGGDDE